MISSLSITLPTFSTLSIKQLYRPRPEPLLWMYFLLLSFTFWAKFSVCCIYFHWEEQAKRNSPFFYVVWLSKGHRQIEGKGEQNKLHKSNNHPKIKLITKNATIFPSFEGQMGKLFKQFTGLILRLVFGTEQVKQLIKGYFIFWERERNGDNV